ncbi:hypothetical protein HanRHA438_Chr02g0079541 [Helianthus annuus]|nr:hypothetical protein HanIR_Chr02g0080381 [Helianthus annuus]KAJ0940102.1 hypothetical protein HanRHA438_Chr02g0079541 [Helianthus annuus]
MKDYQILEFSGHQNEAIERSIAIYEEDCSSSSRTLGAKQNHEDQRLKLVN